MTSPKNAKATKSTNATTTNQEKDTMKTTIAPTTETTTSSTTAAIKASATVTTNTGLAALVTQLSAALDAAEAQMGPEPTLTTATDKRRRGKPRKGSEKVLTQLAPVVKQYGLDSSALNTDAMLTRHQTAQTLVPLQARLQKVSKRVDDEVFGAQTDAWDMGLQFYSLLRRRAKTDGNVAKALEPMAKSFSSRNSSSKEGKPTKMQTRVKARLKATVALAQKHGVTVSLGPDGGATSIAGPAQAVAAAQAEVAASAPPAPTAAAPATPPAAPAPSAAPSPAVARS